MSVSVLAMDFSRLIIKQQKKTPIKRKRNVEFECDQAKQKYLDTI